MAEMFDLISKFADTSLQDGQHKTDLISKGEFKKVIYFEFLGDNRLFRMQILLDLYVIGKTLSKEQGIVQLFKMCDRMFNGFLNKMNFLLSIYGILPTVQSLSLNNLNETFQLLEWHNVYSNNQKFPNVCYSLDR